MMKTLVTVSRTSHQKMPDVVHVLVRTTRLAANREQKKPEPKPEIGSMSKKGRTAIPKPDATRTCKHSFPCVVCKGVQAFITLHSQRKARREEGRRCGPTETIQEQSLEITRPKSNEL